MVEKSSKSEKKVAKNETNVKRGVAWYKGATPQSKRDAKQQQQQQQQQPPDKKKKALVEMESFLQTLKDNKKKGIAGTAPEKGNDSRGSGGRGSGGGPVIRRTFKDPLSDLKK